MSEFSPILERVAAQRTNELVTRSRAPRFPGRRRPRGRHGLAERLHALASRIDQ